MANIFGTDKLYPSEILKKHPDVTSINNEQPGPGETGKRIQYVFEYSNGYKVSVVTGYGARGDFSAPYELGLIYEGLGMISMEDITDHPDTVSGFNTEDEILEKLEIIKSKE